MKELKNKFSEIYNSPYKPLIRTSIIAIVLLLLLWIVPNIISKVKAFNVARSPITGISVINEKSYLPTDVISPKDFDVSALHKNGDTTKINNSEIKISTTAIKPVGKTTPITVTYDKYSCEIEVKNERKEVVSVECGKYKSSDVKAVLYTNGELCFEGKGDIKQYHIDKAPWYTMETDDTLIQSVTFEKGVKPKNLDYYFKDFKNLKYIYNIPKSIESATAMCLNCYNLVEGPDFSNCKKLLNLNSAFENCTNIKTPAILPPNLQLAASCYKSCINLETIGNVADCSKLEITSDMYNGCESLITATFPKNVKSVGGMYANCINLEESLEVPNGVIYMDGTFANDISLRTVPNIPASVKNIRNTFENCVKLEGTMQINCVTPNYTSFFEKACYGNPLNLTGNSPMLDALAYTSESTNITVNGNAPNEEASKFNYNEYLKSLETTESEE